MRQIIQGIAESSHYRATHLLQILRQIQFRYHYIPQAAIEQLSDLLNIPRTQIVSVVEFYSFFHLTPRGQYELLISDSITDHMLGKKELIGYLAKKLDVAIGEVRKDGVVSLDNTSCTGMCDQGPAGLVNGYALTRLDHAGIDKIAELVNQQKPLNEWPA
ncbi:MAG: NADH-quinone oxidoreductase subunit NuoE family protein, partial [Methylobacter sp.]